MKKIFYTLVVILITTLLVACAPTEEDTPTPVTTYKLSQASLFSEPNNSIVEYTGSGKTTSGGIVTTLTLTGSNQRSLMSISGFEGKNTRTETLSLVMKFSNGSTTTSNTTEAIEFDGDNEYLLTERDSDDLIYAIDSYAGKSGGKLEPYHYAVANNGGYIAYTIQACGAVVGSCPSPTTVATKSYTFTMMGTENVNVGGANYETYKIKETFNQVAYTSAFSTYESTGTYWYHPKLGILKGEELATFDSGSIVELSYTAISHNFGKP
jgi:hypothetical protein